MNRLFIGPCPICGRTVWEYKDQEIDGKIIKVCVQNSLGTHFWIRSNYNSIAKFAICKHCLEKLDMEKVALVVDLQVFTWLWDMHLYKREQFNKYRFYKAVEFFKTEEEAMKAVKIAGSY